MPRAHTPEQPALLDAADVAQAFGVALEVGLSSEDAAVRLARDGPNQLRLAARPSPWRRALAQLRDPLVYLLLGAGVVALTAWAIEGRHGLPIDAAVIAVVIVVNALLGWLQENKAETAVAALARMTETMSTTLRDGKVVRIASTALVRGDVLVLGEGDAVGADARIVHSSSLRMLEASLTGESGVVSKDAATLPEPVALAERRNMVYKGTSVAQGNARAVVTATGMHSEIGAIATMLDATESASSALQLEIARIGRVLGMAAVVIAVGVVATILIVEEVRAPADVMRVLLLGVSLAVAAVPEGLPAILSVVLALGVQRMAGRHAIVKKLASVETLGSASVIATDKTGTLTRAEMTIVRIVTPSGQVEVGGVGYAPTGPMEVHGAVLGPGPLHEEAGAVLSAGCLAGNAALHALPGGNWDIQGDPTDAAFLVAERKLGATAAREARFVRCGEIPFTSERRCMSSIETDSDHPGTRIMVTKGAPGVVLAMCRRVRIGTSVVALDDAARLQFEIDASTLADAALRTLAVACRSLDPSEDPAQSGELERDLIYLGCVGIIDPPRTEVAPAIRAAQQAGIRVVMITGDHPRTALRIAIDLGIVAADAAALTGLELDALDDVAFARAVAVTSVFARVAPRNKLRIVRVLQAAGEVVAMTGDGVNDAPALKAADIGIAMGMTGTDVTKEAARMILADDNFATIVDAVREGRGVLDNIRKFLRYLLSSNLGEVLTVFLGVLGAGLIGLDATPEGRAGAMVLPLLATQILWINLITDSGPALAMGVDPIADDTMRRRPRLRGERMVGLTMWAGIAGTGLVMALAALMTIDIFLPGGLVEGDESLAVARTAGFTVLVLAQLFNCFNARSETASAFHDAFGNRWLWGTVAVSAGLQLAVVHLGFLNQAFGTVPLTPAQWLVCAAMASTVLWVSELRKLLQRSRRGREQPVIQLPAQRDASG